MITEDMRDCRMLISNNARLMYLFLILTTCKSDIADSHASPLFGKGREGRRQTIGEHERKQNHNERFTGFFRMQLSTYETNVLESIKLSVALIFTYWMVLSTGQAPMLFRALKLSTM